jgi:formylglycine-generating enzyme required for sulfatase activity
MRAALIRLSCLLSLLIATSGSAVTMAWTPIGNPGNACDPQRDVNGLPICVGAVGYSYQISTYDVTNAQYAEFLNAKAASDPLGLYNANMGDPSATGSSNSGYGGIRRNGASGSYTYRAILGHENMPVNYVSFSDAMRFANWMNNGQGNGGTETGAYTLLGGTATPSNVFSVTRNPGATIGLPSENEWYKAAYYDASSASYFAYPAGSNHATTCAAPTATPNSANCNAAAFPPFGELTPVGSYTGSASPYGAFDMGGDVHQWNDAIFGSDRGLRGGNFLASSFFLAASSGGENSPTIEYDFIGIRLSMIPEPGTGLLVFAGLLGLSGWRRASA